MGSEVKLCTWLSPSRQLRKQCRAAWYSPCCWSCCPSWKRPSLPPFSIPSPSRRRASLPSELRLPRTNLPLFSSSGCRRCTRAPQVERGSLQPVRELPDEGSEPTSTHTHTSSEGSPRRREASGRASAPASQGQVARSRLRQRRRVARRRDPFPLLTPPPPPPTAPPPSPLAGCTRKGGQRKWESIHSVSGRADGQSLLCSALQRWLLRCVVLSSAGLLSGPGGGRGL